ncbi:MAG: DUF6029 family protein [Candidatus Cloacimonetes bacterium]|nr:DUF6029 family protein [Candidatus Cloacimonadota bacterium]MDD3097856.1 DUF6029 family protein [Candidatus Cloacimonadota bacterium]
MNRKLCFLIIFSLLILTLSAQSNLQINGINEAQMIYRSAEDSLNVYFRDSFAFNLAYRNFLFGMKFIADLPKYSNQQTELMQDLDPNRLDLGWKELYVSYSQDAFSIHAGTTAETFGQGLTFRSYEDIEFDEDHRIESFLVKYDKKLKLKAFYGGIESPSYTQKYDLAYGADAQYPLMRGVQLGASALGFRNLGVLNQYAFRDVFAARSIISLGNMEAYAEYAYSNNYKMATADTEGQAIYANVDYMIGPLMLGGAYKLYDDFSYRLHDLPLANHHGETLSDALASGLDEEGWQARTTLFLSPTISFSADYAEAWDEAKDKQMNDLYLEAAYSGSGEWLLSYSHIEKLNDSDNQWQKEYYPALSAGITAFNTPLKLQAEFKTVEKQSNTDESSHYEPKLQADFSLNKLALSLGLASHWEDFSSIAESRYMPSIEAKYPLFSHSDILIFAGKEAGGKVCRNGVCRFVAPFEGIKAELTTRF